MAHKSFKYATFVIRHRWEKDSHSLLKNYEANKIRKVKEIGIWFKKYKAVGSIGDKDILKIFQKENLVNNYMIGVNLIVCKMWVDFRFRKTFGK